MAKAKAKTKAKQTTVQKWEELMRLSKQSQLNLYKMLKLVDEILRDFRFVDKRGGESKVIEDMQETHFGYLGKKLSLKTMLSAYRANPDEATWAKYKYNIDAMIILCEAPDKNAGKKVKVNWVAKCKELQLELEKLKSELSQKEATLNEYRTTNAELRAKCEVLISENGQLKGQVSILTTLTKNQAA